MKCSRNIDLLVSNTHMAVTIDLGHPTNVHPTDKKRAGERLARLALKHEYGKDIVAQAPQMIGFSDGGDSATLIFDRPIKLTSETTLAIAAKDRNFQSVIAKQNTPNTLTISTSPTSSELLASVRYAWENDPKATILCAETGLPVAPFRTDNWPLVTANSTSVSAATVSANVPKFENGTSFEDTKAAEITSLKLDGLSFTAKPGHAEIDRAHAYHGEQCLHLFGGDKRELMIGFSQAVEKGANPRFPSRTLDQSSTIPVPDFRKSEGHRQVAANLRRQQRSSSWPRISCSGERHRADGIYRAETRVYLPRQERRTDR